MDEGQDWACARDQGLPRAFGGHAGPQGAGGASGSCPRKRIGLAQLGAKVMTVIAIITQDTGHYY